MSDSMDKFSNNAVVVMSELATSVERLIDLHDPHSTHYPGKLEDVLEQARDAMKSYCAWKESFYEQGT